MISEARKQALSHFAEGRKHYRNRDFVTALKYFDAAFNSDPTDAVSDVFVTRCRELIENPPAEGWDGVFVMKTK
jgi:adenylate cyclase